LTINNLIDYSSYISKTRETSMKYRWKDGKAQAIAYVPALGKCVVVKEANSIHDLYGGDEDGDEDEDDDDTDEDEEKN